MGARQLNPRWYHSAIIDWMIANPGGKLYECAAYVGKSPSHLSVIVNSDMFKAALARRRAEVSMRTDLAIISKTTQVASEGLDCILEVLKKKRDTIPLETLHEVTDGALARLGYGAKVQAPPPGTTVIGQQNNTTVIAPVSAQDLAEARMALRHVQSQRATLPIEHQSGAEPGKVIEGDVVASVISQD